MKVKIQDETEIEDSEKLIFKSRNHSLNIKEKLIVSRLFKLDIGDFDHQPNELSEIFSILSDANENDVLEVNISSYGGFAEELQKFLNLFQRRFYKRVYTILNPHGYSSGALLFLAGDTRIIYENSNIMFHDISMGVHGKHSDIKTQAKFNETYYDNFIKNNLKYFFTEAELNRILEGQEVWLDAKSMLEREIATDIMIFGNDMTAKEYLNYCNNKKDRLRVLLELSENIDELCDIDRRRVEYELEALRPAKTTVKSAKLEEVSVNTENTAKADVTESTETPVKSE